MSILLQGVSLHSLRFDTAQTAAFESAIRRIRAGIEVEEDDDSAILLTGSAVTLLEQYNDAAGAAIHARQEESEKAIALLSDALLEVSHATPAAMVRLKEIERDFGAALSPGALAGARQQLAALLDGIRDRAAGKKPPTPSGEVDSITGLPDSGFAMAAMQSVWDRRHDYFAAMFAVDRLESINARFGFKAGDQVLLILSQHVAQHIGSNDQLFRWRGPCLLALMERNMPEALVASEASRIVGHRMEHAITMGDREVMVPITASWNLFPLSAAESVEDITAILNEFALHRGVRSASAR